MSSEILTERYINYKPTDNNICKLLMYFTRKITLPLMLSILKTDLCIAFNNCVSKPSEVIEVGKEINQYLLMGCQNILLIF